MSDFSFDDGFSKANQYSGKGQHREAEQLYRQCLLLRPDEEWVLNNLGHSLVQLGRLQEAISVLQRVAHDHPNNLTAHANLAAAWEQSGQKHEALGVRRRLTHIKPESADFHSDLGNVLLSLGRAEEAMQSYQTALSLAPSNQSVVHNYLLATNYADTLSAEEVAQIHFKLGATGDAESRHPDAFANARNADRRLKIGYVSTDFSTHPVGKLMVGILAATRDTADNYCYSDSNKDDRWTAKLRQQSHAFTTIAGRTDAEFVDLVRNDQVDVLVDLNGHTGGQNRLNAFGLGAAPVQVSFLGYPNTTGHPGVDFYISDEFCTPVGMADHLFREKLWRLPTGCIATQPLADIPVPANEPFQKNGYFTFGSFNNPAKVSPSTLSAWADILRGVPGSRLQVRYAKAFRSNVLRERWLDRLCSSGVNCDRIDFITEPLPFHQHLATFADVDLCLDPFPYQGTMTTLESLYMGSPVLTKAGRNYCQRASSSLLLRIGEHQLVTGSVEEYTATAVQYGLHPERLRPLRNRIRGKVRQSSICDVEELGQELLGAFTKMWASWRESEGDYGSTGPARRTIFVAGEDSGSLIRAADLVVAILAYGNGCKKRLPLHLVQGIPIRYQLQHVRAAEHDMVLIGNGVPASEINEVSKERKDIMLLHVHSSKDKTKPVCELVDSKQCLEMNADFLSLSPESVMKPIANWLKIALSDQQLASLIHESSQE